MTMLAVEHIQPKGLPAYAHLTGRWSNFLLACVNCNSTKKDKDVDPANVLLPDRDNTFVTFQYLPDGTIVPSANATANGLGAIAEATLSLTGLDKAALNTPNENDVQVALDRMSQRMEAWLEAMTAKDELGQDPAHLLLRNAIVRQALAKGFFSVWMIVFAGDKDMRLRLISAFQGTENSGCFDNQGNPLSPAPNPDGLSGGGKI